MTRDELTPPGWGDAADYFCERDKKYGTTELNVLLVILRQTEDDAASSAPTTFGQPMETLDGIPAKSQILQVTSHLRSSHGRLGSREPQTDNFIPSLPPDAPPVLSTIQ